MLASEAAYLKGLLQWRTNCPTSSGEEYKVFNRETLSAYLPLRDGRYCLDFLKSRGGWGDGTAGKST